MCDIIDQARFHSILQWGHVLGGHLELYTPSMSNGEHTSRTMTVSESIPVATNIPVLDLERHVGKATHDVFHMNERS